MPAKVRKIKIRTRKYSGHCEGCNAALCACKVYQYVDENNEAITNSSPYLCAKCYEKRYGVHIPTDVGRYRDSLINHLERLTKAANSPEIQRALQYVIQHISEHA